MKLYALPENIINNTLTYLGSKPFAEVAALITDLQKAQLVVNADGSALEVPDVTPAAVSELAPATDAPQAEPVQDQTVTA